MVATLKKGATKEYIDELLKKIANEIRTKGIDTRKYCGELELKEDSLKVQKRLRDEW